MNNYFIASIAALVITTGIGAQQMNAAGSQTKQQVTAAQTRLEALQKERSEWQAKVTTLQAEQTQVSGANQSRLLRVFDARYDDFVADFNANHTRGYRGGFGVEAYRFPAIPADIRAIVRTRFAGLSAAEADRLIAGADVLRAKEWYTYRPNRAKSYSKGWLANKTGRYNHEVTNVDIAMMLFLEFMVAEGKL